jgi:hypothetical protein
MGCGQPVPISDDIIKITKIPCTAEDIGRYINDIRVNPKKYE